MDESDERLFALLQGGQERAFDVLFNRYWDRLLQQAFYKLQVQEEAEEVVQQVFLDLWRNRQKIDLRFSFLTYISAAVKYQVYAMAARRRANTQLPLQHDGDASFVDDSTREWLSFNDVRDKLEVLLSQLPEKCELVFRLSREEGLSNQEIAERVGISTKTVEAHITKAIKLLRSGMKRPWILSFPAWIVISFIF